MEHVTRTGAPKLVAACDLPLTGRGVVSRVITDLGVLDVAGDGLRARRARPRRHRRGGRRAHRRAGPAAGRGLIVTPGPGTGRRPRGRDLAARVRRLEDLHAIGQLRAHYCQALDDGRWDDLVDLFTPDGAFVGLSTARGHDELRTFFADLQDGPLSAWWHFSSNETIDLVARRTRPRGDRTTWLDQPCVVDGRAHVAAGRYRDRMVRGDDGRWRFAERRVTFFSGCPPTRTGPPHASAGHPPAAADAHPRAGHSPRAADPAPSAGGTTACRRAAPAPSPPGPPARRDPHPEHP